MKKENNNLQLNNKYKNNKFSLILKRMSYYKYLYLMALPPLLFFLIFRYIPIYGIQLAFKKFMFNKGIMASPWIGLNNFTYIFRQEGFWRAVRNTIEISFLRIVLASPLPVILAILINELQMKMRKYTRILQTVYTFPHFLSWVILSGIMFNLLSQNGAINNVLAALGFDKYHFFTNVKTFRFLLVYSNVWKEIGWGTIIYLAAITGIDPHLYEAATCDGANRWHKIIHITWPGIKSIFIVMIILQVGRIMNESFFQILNLYNPVVYKVADVINTYVYRMTFERGLPFGIGSAIGLFKGVTNCILLFTANALAKKFGDRGLV